MCFEFKIIDEAYDTKFLEAWDIVIITHLINIPT